VAGWSPVFHDDVVRRISSRNSHRKAKYLDWSYLAWFPSHLWLTLNQNRIPENRGTWTPVCLHPSCFMYGLDALFMCWKERRDSQVHMLRVINVQPKEKKMCWPYFTWDARERGPWVALSGAFLVHSSIVNNEVLDISITPQQMLSLNLNESGEHSSNHHSATRWNTSHY